MKRKQKIIITSGLTAIISVLFYYCYPINHQNEIQSEPISGIDSTTKNINSIHANSSKNNSTSIEQAIAPEQTNISAMSPSDRKKHMEDVAREQKKILFQEVNDWRISHGYLQAFSPETLQHIKIEDPYAQYDDETLRELADNGDYLAKLSLGRRLISNKDYDEAETVIYDAALYGYGSALHEMKNIYIERAKQSYTNKDKYQFEGYLTEALAWEQVHYHRFAPHKIETQKIRAFNLPKEKAKTVKQNAIKLGEELYSKLVRDRNDLGLGELDNSIPEALKKIGR